MAIIEKKYSIVMAATRGSMLAMVRNGGIHITKFDQRGFADR